ncbi:MAG: hypothetical protein KBD50_03780 [Candidatus Pacebacteria bacterium]|nr:hypothetical protein [Candidatus Paceibacterota bacterium]
MNNTSGINTIILIVLLVLVVGGGVWWYTMYGPGAEKQDSGIEINLGGE